MIATICRDMIPGFKKKDRGSENLHNKIRTTVIAGKQREEEDQNI